MSGTSDSNQSGPFELPSEAISHFESNGNVAATNPTSTASGAYQITNGTWRQFAPQTGVSLSQYPTASSAPLNVQTQVAYQIPLARWNADSSSGSTTFEKMNSQFNGIFSPGMTLGQADAIANESNGGFFSVGTNGYPDPNETSAYQTANINNATQQQSTFGAIGNSIVSTVNNVPSDVASAVSGIGTPILAGLQSSVENWGNSLVSGVESSVGKAFGNLLTDVENWFVRGSLIFLGIILLVTMLAVVAMKSDTVKKTAPLIMGVAK